jgi:hypothetical protein
MCEDHLFWALLGLFAGWFVLGPIVGLLIVRYSKGWL